MTKPVKTIIALLAGITAVLAFSPFEYSYLVFISFAVVIILIKNTAPKSVFGTVYIFSLGFFGFGVSWVHVSMFNYGNMSLPLAILVASLLVAFLSLIPALFVAFGRYLAVRLKLTSNAWLGLVIPVCWGLSEWFRSWFLTGFPWLNLGVSQVDSVFGAFLPLIGEFGVSLLAVMLASLAVMLATGSNKTRIITLLIGAVIVISAFSLEKISWTRNSGKKLTVGLVQGNIPIKMKWDSEYVNQTLDIYWNNSEKLLAAGADLIVWPETAIPVYYHRFKDNILPHFNRSLDNYNANIISGIIYRDQDGMRNIYNSLVLLGGEKHQFYHKRNLVPFGEYVPLANLFIGFIMDELDIPMSDLVSGDDVQEILTVNGIYVNSTVCYEAAYAGLVRENADKTRFLLTVSNDGWFGTSFARHQHLQIARARARENGKYMVRATNNGITAVINNNGKVIADLPPDAAGTVLREIELFNGVTPFACIGNYGFFALTGMIFLSLLFRCSRRSEDENQL